MSLHDFYDPNQSDKNTIHSYLDTYEMLMGRLKDKATNVLEVGIGDHYKNKSVGVPHGGSLVLWKKYFKNANIYGVEIQNFRVLDELNTERIKIFLGTNAYDKRFIDTHLSDKKFDVLIDDGPHTLKSQLDFIRLYSDLLTEDGLLIIEDVADISWLEKLKQVTPDHLKPYIQTFDLRNNKGRFDDIIFAINRTDKIYLNFFDN